MSNRQVEINVKIKRSTAAALLVNAEMAENVWIPRSQISDFTGHRVEEAESIFIPEWLATEKGLV